MKRFRRAPLLAAALLLGVSANADSSVKEAAKQFGHAIGSAGRAIGKAGAQAGRQVGHQVKHDAPPALRSLRDANHVFWQKRKAEAKQAFGKLRGSAAK